MKDQEIGTFETFYDGKRHLLSLPKDWNSDSDTPLKFIAKIENDHLIYYGPKIQKGVRK